MPHDAVAARSAAREALILGRPPRIAPLAPEEFTHEAKALTKKIDHAAGLDPGEHVSEWLATVLRHPALFTAHTELAVTLMVGKLPARDRELAVLRAVEEMLGDAMISDETWGVLAKTYDEAQLLELPILIGQYLGVAFLQNSLRVVLPEGYQGLRAR
jgi:4-carboxymuconolactone decarboxylase